MTKRDFFATQCISDDSGNDYGIAFLRYTALRT